MDKKEDLGTTSVSEAKQTAGARLGELIPQHPVAGIR